MWSERATSISGRRVSDLFSKKQLAQLLSLSYDVNGCVIVKHLVYFPLLLMILSYCVCFHIRFHHYTPCDMINKIRPISDTF